MALCRDGPLAGLSGRGQCFSISNTASANELPRLAFPTGMESYSFARTSLATPIFSDDVCVGGRKTCAPCRTSRRAGVFLAADSLIAKRTFLPGKPAGDEAQARAGQLDWETVVPVEQAGREHAELHDSTPPAKLIFLFLFRWHVTEDPRQAAKQSEINRQSQARDNGSHHEEHRPGGGTAR